MPSDALSRLGSSIVVVFLRLAKLSADLSGAAKRLSEGALAGAIV